MVSNCVAEGCHNVQDKNKGIAFHTFPFKRPDILKLWISAVGRENWFPSKTSKICGEHFLLSDYHSMPGYRRKLLKVDAVPSIFNSPKQPKKRLTTSTDLEEPIDVGFSICDDDNSPASSKSTITIYVKCEDPNIDLDVSLPFRDGEDSDIDQDVSLSSASTTTPTTSIDSEHSDSDPDVGLLSSSTNIPRTSIDSNDSDGSLPSSSIITTKTSINSVAQTSENYLEFTYLKRKLKTLQQKVRRRDVQISNMKEIISEILKNG